MEVVENTSENPVCPHCEKQLTKIMSKKISSNFGVRFIYFCGLCKKVLGFSHRKGFWMG